MSADVKTRRHSVRGNSILEFVLIAPLMFVVVLLLIDLARYQAARAVVRKIAQNAINYVQKVHGLEADLRNVTSRSDPKFLRYEAAVRGASEVVRKLALAFGVELADYHYTDAQGAVIDPPVKLLVLRPGDMAYDDYERKFIAHPIVCPFRWSKYVCAEKLSPSASWGEILRTKPIYVEVRTRMKSYFPYLGLPAEIPVRAIALGLREIASDTDLPPAVSPVIPTVVTTTTTSLTTTTTVGPAPTPTPTMSTTTSSTTTSTTEPPLPTASPTAIVCNSRAEWEAWMTSSCESFNSPGINGFVYWQGGGSGCWCKHDIYGKYHVVPVGNCTGSSCCFTPILSGDECAQIREQECAAAGGYLTGCDPLTTPTTSILDCACGTFICCLYPTPTPGPSPLPTPTPDCNVIRPQLCIDDGGVYPPCAVNWRTGKIIDIECGAFDCCYPDCNAIWTQLCVDNGGIWSFNCPKAKQIKVNSPECGMATCCLP